MQVPLVIDYEYVFSESMIFPVIMKNKNNKIIRTNKMNQMINSIYIFLIPIFK